MSLNVDAIRSALYTWMKRESGFEVIFADQHKTRPAVKPYGTLRFLNPAQRQGSVDESRMNGANLALGRVRATTASLNFIGKNSLNLMAKVRDSLDRPDVIAEFAAAGIAHVGESAILDLTAALETKFEERAQMDLFLRTTSLDNVLMDFFETVEVTGQVNNLETEMEIEKGE